ncbi:MAG: glycosyltransferase family 87 protein, partial [Ginsengibacter sp.]
FSLLSVNAGAFFWGIANAAVLFFAIRSLPVRFKNQNIILWLSAIEMMTSVQNMQINCLVAAMIILALVFVRKEQDFWATLFIALGFLIKLYGIVGIVFILFSHRKIKFATSFLFWLIILFCLPMLLSSPSFIVHSYFDWYHTLVVKDNANTVSLMQNISVMGMLRHVFKIENINLVVICIGAMFYLLPLFRLNQWKNLGFQLSYLCLALIGVVIFSSSAESPTYIIAVAGVGIWFVLQNPKTWLVISLVVFMLCFTSLSSTDFFPRFIKLNFIQPYSLKALPCFIIWIVIAFQLIIKDFYEIKIGYDRNTLNGV